MNSIIGKIKPNGQYRFILFVFLIIATLMISSAVIELRQSKKELFQLMTKQAHSLLESLIIASQNSLHATAYLDELTQQRLLNNAGLVKRMYEKNQLSNKILDELSDQNRTFRALVFDKQGNKIYSSYHEKITDQPAKHDPRQILQPIFKGDQDTLMIGYKQARFAPGYRFAVAVATKDRSAIVINIAAEEMLKFKRDIDFGALIRKVVKENPQILYIALQSPETILAASGAIRQLDSIEQSVFLQKVIEDSSFATRTALFDKSEIFEAVLPFANGGEIIGLFRLGLSLEPVREINDRIFRRMIIITLILIAIGIVLFVYIFTQKRLNVLQKEYRVVETYSGSIIDNVSDAIIVLDKLKGIKIFNAAAEKLFGVNKNEALHQALTKIFSQPECLILLKEESVLKQMSCKIGERQKDLLTSKSTFLDPNENENTILVIRDLTEQKQMQAQLERQQRLTAMGELASGVAHEIRNPLNTIGTIVQQLDKDFEPAEDKEEYHELAGLVYNEVKRINETVQDFLRFSRPEPVQPTRFLISDLIAHIETQYKQLMETQQIKLETNINWQGEVFWDNRQMKQVFINLIQNAMDAIGQNGHILISINAEDDKLIIQLKDDGPGMPEKIRTNIFNLYFTTKAEGTGIGLSIVQRIIYEHGGVISVESEPGHGTVFTIQLPFLV